MSAGCRKLLGPWSLLVIALAIAGTGLDALAATLLPNARARQSVPDDELTGAEGSKVIVASQQIRLRRRRAPLACQPSPLRHFALPASRPAIRRAMAVGIPPDRSALLCRFRC